MNTKFYLIVLILSSIGFQCMAQPVFLQQETDHNRNIYFAKLRTDTVPQSIGKSMEFLKSLYSAKNTDDFRLSETRKVKQDELGYTHQFYQQYYKNVKIEDSEVGVHANRQGNIEMVSGFFHAVGDVDIEAKLTEAQALQHALAYIGAESYKW